MKHLPVVIILIILLAGCNAGKGAENTASEGPQEITLADLQFSDLNGDTFSGNQFVGKPVFVHFWATWCRPCIKEMPHLADAMQKTKNITFIFPSDESIKKIAQFRDKNSFPFQYLQITTGFGAVGFSALPATFIFNSKGELIKKISGSRDWKSQEMVDFLNALSYE